MDVKCVICGEVITGLSVPPAGRYDVGDTFDLLCSTLDCDGTGRTKSQHVVIRRYTE